MASQNPILENLAAELDKRRRLEKRLRLLDAIANTASLAAAARLTGVSYKTAWNHIRELSARSGEALVDTTIGGAKGGGSRLTPAGEALLKLLRIQRNGSQQQLAQSLPALRFSARNQIPARISAIDAQGVIARIVLRIGDIELNSHITRSSIARLELTPGGDVFAIIKASAIDLVPPHHRIPEGDINCLPARITSCESSPQGREIELHLKGGFNITLARTYDPSEETWIQQGAEVRVLIQPEEIMLATTAGA
ncbi:DNA-binding domain of ModE [Marinobacterium lacunae]|uniref:DNA-binding domain of ModE n=1 Tax=Marinobacterium lacunae TaxID=1232683 RepID=A0A081FYU1_9GAMM|nr:TOBE domain-containing protein [Marinobacterium lacunae]KEA63696.1 DNA-binding domain of ModE [Marinobacterium lacunae]